MTSSYNTDPIKILVSSIDCCKLYWWFPKKCYKRSKPEAAGFLLPRMLLAVPDFDDFSCSLRLSLILNAHR